LSHHSGCHVAFNFCQVSGIHCNGVTLTIELGQVWVSVWLNRGFFVVNF
jgi:hypothetical protein